MSARATLTDVARTAGVSLSTASLAFSGAGPISGATRDRVLAAANALGYAGPNPVAASLRRGQSKIIGVLVGRDLRVNFRDPVAVQTLGGVASALGDAARGMLLVPAADDELAGGQHLIRHGSMDAAVVLHASGRETSRILRGRGVPMVWVDRAGPGAVSVRVQDKEGMAALGRHLVGLGHRHVALATMPWTRARTAGPVNLAGPRPQARYIGDRLAGLTEAGIHPVAVESTTGSLVEEGIRAGHALLDRSPRPTALVGFSDLIAAGLLLAANERGLRVPEDVSVAGFDGVDLPWLGEHRLTSVVQPAQEKGEQAARTAVALADGEQPRPVVLECHLRVGTTTGPAPT
ncbi:LacI family DNA-binding transcriptional regulator [Ruania alba]|uniref:DNA-binding transcriptional regulator, LacI/PurR family n=1 Tax=Ruania alba TaxID=648782 RepID=A0A1H5C0W2_9MICO|nr:LacI family DNA-binding transcriptional regulator [Ruania alba]SED60101.1 DNA-binding transcriptional regulator, LacI/PurR family [Ruania alba]